MLIPYLHAQMRFGQNLLALSALLILAAALAHAVYWAQGAQSFVPASVPASVPARIETALNTRAVSPGGSSSDMVLADMPSGPAVVTERRAESAPSILANSYQAALLRVIDGDTVAVRIQIWLGQELVTKVRLKGIDAPELNGACPSEITRAHAAREALIGLIGHGDVKLTEIMPDKYGGRVVARLWSSAGVDLGAALVTRGHAKIWRGRRETTWCAIAPHQAHGG
jgi:micrococcal nuclease